jgi:hypothetical protein
MRMSPYSCFCSLVVILSRVSSYFLRFSMLIDPKTYALLRSLHFSSNAKRNPCWLMGSGVGMEHRSSIKDKTEDEYIIRMQ